MKSGIKVVRIPTTPKKIFSQSLKKRLTRKYPRLNRRKKRTLGRKLHQGTSYLGTRRRNPKSKMKIMRNWIPIGNLHLKNKNKMNFQNKFKTYKGAQKEWLYLIKRKRK